MMEVLPVPEAPTISSGWPCCRARSSKYVYLRRSYNSMTHARHTTKSHTVLAADCIMPTASAGSTIK